MKKIVVLSGAGISAESGLKTFRDSDGLWENYRVEDVATPSAWMADRQLVLTFYNERRKQVRLAQPNAAHLALAKLEAKYDVRIVTQNIDDLHERAGSSRVLHLHGEILKARSTLDPKLIYPVSGDLLEIGDTCEKGSQLRPHIVWFGEMVPELENAALLVSQADVLMVIGTSLNVYPAAGLINYARPEAEKYLIDPGSFTLPDFTFVKKKAGTGVPEIVELLLKEAE
jgi:NAD-dependent deacetylase